MSEAWFYFRSTHGKLLIVRLCALVHWCRADPNVMSETGFTSLILAAAGGHLEVVKTLVEKVSRVSKLYLSVKRLCSTVHVATVEAVEYVIVLILD